MRLHVGRGGPEELFRPRDRQRLGDIDELAAAVVALSRIALGVLVRQYRPGGFEDRLADEVFRGDELEAGVLSMPFAIERRGDIGIGVGERSPTGWCFGFCHVKVRVLLRATTLAR